MKKKLTRRGKFSKVYARVTIFILGVLIFVGLITIPKVVSTAQIIEQLGLGPYLPIIMKDSYFGPTYTITPTGTLPSPTTTGTAGPSPTQTLTPSPTYTGTLTPNPSITISVNPFSAKVNEILTFTITVKNTGTGPTPNNQVFDNFPVSYIDVSEVKSTKGTIIKQSRSFIVTIGDIFPGEVVTITAVVKVNSSLTTTTINSNLVTLTYDEGASKTYSVTYKVVAQTLPPTGELPLNWSEDRVKPLAIVSGIVLMVLGGLSLLLLVWWSKARNPKDKLWMTVGGTLLIMIGLVFVVTSSGLVNPIKLTQEDQTPTTGGIIALGQPVEPTATALLHKPASAFSTPDSVVPIVTLPDYPIPTAVITGTPQPGEVGPDTSAVTRIVIPALLLDTQVKYVPYDGVSWMITGLRQEVAWMGNTSRPGLGGNTGLAGHVTVAGMGDGPFRHLDQLPVGELVLLYTQKNIYTYQVRESKVTDDGDMSVILPSDNPQISLITCTDWDQESRTYLSRLVVIADLIRTEPITIGRAP
jgi:LPXTG-site transpeptidase (sortase) family protein